VIFSEPKQGKNVLLFYQIEGGGKEKKRGDRNRDNRGGKRGGRDHREIPFFPLQGEGRKRSTKAVGRKKKRKEDKRRAPWMNAQGKDGARLA